MSVDIGRQLQEYCRVMDEAQGLVSFDDVVERTGEHPVIPGRQVLQTPRRRRWLVVASVGLAIAVIALELLLGTLPDQPPQPADQPTTTAQPTTTTTVIRLNTVNGAAQLEPGRYEVFGPAERPSSEPSAGWPSSMEVTLPSGWTAWSRVRGGHLTRESATMTASSVENVVADLCTGEMLDPLGGSSIDDLVEALTSIPGVTTRSVTVTNLDDYDARRVDLTIPTDVPGCPEGTAPETINMIPWSTGSFLLWVTPPTEGHPWHVTSFGGWKHSIWILDVEGLRFVIDLGYDPDLKADEVAALHQIVQTIEIQS